MRINGRDIIVSFQGSCLQCKLSPLELLGSSFILKLVYFFYVFHKKMAQAYNFLISHNGC